SLNFARVNGAGEDFVSRLRCYATDRRSPSIAEKRHRWRFLGDELAGILPMVAIFGIARHPRTPIGGPQVGLKPVHGVDQLPMHPESRRP
ncbi:MAG TPA: hypothetical protein VI199_02940, partial [Novosphingobium sp.]